MGSNIEQTAYFMAGHTVGAWLEDLEVERVAVLPNESWIDVVEPELPANGNIWRESDRAGAKSLIRALLFGPAARERYGWGRCGCDVETVRDYLGETVVWRAWNLARRLEIDRPLLPSLWTQVARLIDRDDTWAAVTSLTDALLERSELDGTEVETILKDGLRTTRRWKV
jgi:hypothetical protein